MILLVPDEFRNEVTACTAADLETLRVDTRVLASTTNDKAKIAGKLVEAGWSPGFAEWYAGRVVRDGSDLELRVAAVSNHDQTLVDYNKAKERKEKLNRDGWLLFAGAILLRIALMAVFPDGGAAAAIPLLIGTAVSIFLWFKGLFMVLDSKNQSRWFSLLGLFVVLVPDRNKLTEPSSDVAGSGGGLSNW